MTSQTPYIGYGPTFGKKDKLKTVLIPWFTDFLSPMIPAIAELAGYRFVNCPKTSKTSAETGLRYGNNEVCYPATLVVGDLIAELQTGKYDLNAVAVAITQTGGQCRATNYLSMIKQGLKNAGFGNIPTIAVTLGGQAYQNKQDGFKLPIRKIFKIGMCGLFFGDALFQLYSASIVREKRKGESQQLFDFCMEEARKIILENKPKKMLRLLENAVERFNDIEIVEKKLEKVGLIGEIFVKYNSYGQAHITEWLHEQEIEVMIPPLTGFFMQTFVNQIVNKENGIKRTSALTFKLLPLLYKFLDYYKQKFEKIIQKYRFYTAHESIFEIAQHAQEIIDLSNQFGEGWMIAGEIASFSRRGINRVVCVQPFGCIANHVVAKGIERRIKQLYPAVNLLYLDIDGGMSEVNLQNRLHFLIEKESP
ncbi:MAG: 2-hydroxyacyl-CoA dehydratase [Prevotellaceae bacterium]|jgi:predicted nucleotide-binding protein (sugar kinase/HSP70/actin superfamily)|nr:2-hydroxyacyl-CoA dehydratase [Prevotellaceae bacterium]